MESPLLSKRQLFDHVRSALKNQERAFFPKPRKSHDNRNIDLEEILRLFFNDTALFQISEEHNIAWKVSFVDLNRPRTLSAVLLFNNERVAGIDPEVAPRSYRYDASTRGKSAYHENVISYDKNGVQTNLHCALPIDKLCDDIYEFAKICAKFWHIDYWKNKDLFDV